MRDDAPKPVDGARLSRRAPHLEREKVVAAALQLLNEVGFEGLTLRRLAAKLDVKAAALYWHFDNKQDLINEVAGAIIDEKIAAGTLPEHASWREVLTHMAHATRAALMQYRDGALIIASADLSKSNMFDGRELITRRLIDGGLPADMVVFGFFTVGRYTLGCVFEEQADPYSSDKRLQIGRELWPTIKTDYPAIAQTISALHDKGIPYDPAVHFEQGLMLILDGIAFRLKQSA
jgi:TetR/AcrR family transcriptional regulator, tetracycline repressor protein